MLRMNETDLKEILMKQIPYLQGSSHTQHIHKGYSSDQKYIVIKDNQKYLLRRFALHERASKQQEYEALEKMVELNVTCSRPLAIGTIESSGLGYMLLTYIEGADALEELPAYSDSIQYEIGIAAGKELAKMHQWAAPHLVIPWYDRKLEKHNKVMEQYELCSVRLSNDLKIIAFIDEHVNLMKNRPNVFQHDDFHVGNLIVRDSKLAGVIDFNRIDFGDPVHEFLKTGMFSSEVSVPFSLGQMKGYFDHKAPDELFWKLYSLYLAMSLFSSVVWILKVKPEELSIMMDKINRVLEDHDYFDRMIPRWYLEERNV